MTWAATATPAVRQDVSAMLEVAAEVAGSNTQRGASQPFAVLMDHEGTITLRSAFFPPEADEWEAVSTLADSIETHAAGLRAALLIAGGAAAPDPRARVFGDHREGRPFAGWLEYMFVIGAPARVRSVSVEPMENGLFS
jgi:hypothetical protein